MALIYGLFAIHSATFLPLSLALSMRIEREVVDPDDVEMLQDLIVAAVNEALSKSQEMVSEKMSQLTGGLNIPGLL